MQEAQKVFPPILHGKELEDWVQQTVIGNFVQPEHIPVGEGEKPRYILLTGQAGAGKTCAREKIKGILKGNPPVAFGADDIRALHPKAQEILEKHQADYSRMTKPDAGHAREKLLDHCFTSRRNIMIDSILLRSDDYKMPTLEQARNHGYEVVCMALAVPEELSRVSLFLRQEAQYQQNKIGFPATVEEHDKSYVLLPELLGRMARARTVDRIDILTRDGTVLYSTDPTVYPASDLSPHMDRWNPSLIMEGLRQGRMLTEQQVADIDQSWKKVIQMMHDRGAPKGEIEEAQGYYKSFLNRPLRVGSQGCTRVVQGPVQNPQEAVKGPVTSSQGNEQSKDASGRSFLAWKNSNQGRS